MDNQQQYLLEKQQRLLNYITAEERREEAVRNKVLRETGRLPRAKKQPKAAPKQTSATIAANVPSNATEEARDMTAVQKQASAMALSMDRYLPTRYRVQNLILDSQFRETQYYPNTNDFVLKLTEPLTNVAAIRLMRTEFYQPSNQLGYFVLNEVKVPLQLYNVEHAYLYLNGWVSTTIANDTNTTFFGRIGPGTEFYPAVSGDITQDPFIYVLQPAEPRLKRFHVRLLKADGTPYPVSNARIVITLAVYRFAT